MAKQHDHYAQHSSSRMQLVPRSRHNSLVGFDRSYLGSIHKIWKKLPQSLVKKGATVGWLKIKEGCKFKFSTLLITRKQKKTKRFKNAVKAPVYDEFAIDGFKASRTSEFEIKLVTPHAAVAQEGHAG